MSTILSEFIAEPGSIWSQSIVPLTNLGAKARTDDGREFRYVREGTAANMVVGKLYQSGAESAANWENISVAAAVAGATTVVSTSAVTLAVNVLAGGYLAVTTTTGEGYLYKIAGNTVAAAAAVTIYLEDPLQIALTAATSKVDVIPAPCGAAELWDASNHDGMILGVAVYPVTALYYGWVQTKGPATVLADGGLTVGYLVVASNATDGAVEVAANASTEAQMPIGQAMEGVTTTEYGMVNLNIA